MKNPVVLLQCMSRDQIAAAIDKIKEGRTLIITDPPMYVFLCHNFNFIFVRTSVKMSPNSIDETLPDDMIDVDVGHDTSSERSTNERIHRWLRDQSTFATEPLLEVEEGELVNADETEDRLLLSQDRSADGDQIDDAMIKPALRMAGPDVFEQQYINDNKLDLGMMNPTKDYLIGPFTEERQKENEPFENAEKEEEEEMSNALALQPIVLLERMSRDQIHVTIEQIKDGYMDNEQSTNDNKIVVRGP